MKMEDLKVISVDGQRFLGEIEMENRRVVNALEVDGSGMREYFKASKLGRLVTLDFAEGTSFTSRNLNEKEQASFCVCVQAMEMAEKQAVPTMVCSVFDSIVNAIR